MVQMVLQTIRNHTHPHTIIMNLQCQGGPSHAVYKTWLFALNCMAKQLGWVGEMALQLMFHISVLISSKEHTGTTVMR